MLISILSENCHLAIATSSYFCSMQKSILVNLVLLMTIISCNNQNQPKEKEDRVAQSVSSREKILLDSIVQFPDSLIIKEKLIQYYIDASDYDKAIAFTSQQLSTDSLNDRLWDIKGNLQYENDDTLGAIRAYETALQINPVPKYVILLGSLYAQTKNKKALEIADFLIGSKIPKTETESFFIKGLYYNYAGEKMKAISFFDKCLNLDYNYMFAYREKAIALYDMGRYEDAVTVLDKAVTLQSNFDEGHYWLGRCLEKLNKPMDAIEAYKTALLYAPDYVEAKDALEKLGVK
jgi:tetratricopeptide (TPR) repeat protein